MSHDDPLIKSVIDFMEELFRRGGMFSVFAALLLLAAVFTVAGSVLVKVMSGVTALLEAYKGSGLPWLARRSVRVEVGLRRQFCSVLNSDLAALAKSENWNDQYFTDLEGEVETEGSYYPTVMHRLFRRPRRGLRRVRSLARALEVSAEKVLLVVGEPGSGKSVALRHLGHVLAQRGMRSRAPDARVPLYVNLRELRVAVDREVDANLIKEFVLENIRRGDADTAAYVRDNWQEFRRRGIWVFLFDSFDEIPAVLHAPTDSEVIQGYSQAIRQFLEGMSDCRGILASREYKSPAALPWQKVRILPLSQERQRELVSNTFLDADLKALVRRYLALNQTALSHSPMFVTLLCRYVRETGRAPASEHNLLSSHLDRLATRDSEYIRRKYGLTSEDLLRGAVELAALVARDPRLSLAPTFDELVAVARSLGIGAENVADLLSALVDVKLARTDVQEARPGDRRFTFSHRRYQETLFVRFLASHPGAIAVRELLADSRWRDYVVTLLQTEDGPMFAELLAEAEAVLAERAASWELVPVEREFGVSMLCYGTWDSSGVAGVLSLLQEGLASRLSLVPPSLRSVVTEVLADRWNEGDIMDRLMVLRLGGLARAAELARWVEWAMRSASSRLQSAASEKVGFLEVVTEWLAKRLREHLADGVLLASTLSEVIRLEALAQRFPPYVEAARVVRRCRMLRLWLRWPRALEEFFVGTTRRFRRRDGWVPLERLRRGSTSLESSIVLASLGYYIVAIAMAFPTRTTGYWVVWGVLSVTIIIAVVWLDLLYALRTAGGAISPRTVLRMARESVDGEERIVGISLVALLGLIAAACVRWMPVRWAVGLLVGLMMSAGLVSMVRELWRRRRWRKRLLAFPSSMRATAVVLAADSLEELAIWLSVEGSPILRDRAVFRSLSAIGLAFAEERLSPEDWMVSGSRARSGVGYFIWRSQEALDLVTLPGHELVDPLESRTVGLE